MSEWVKHVNGTAMHPHSWKGRKDVLEHAMHLIRATYLSLWLAITNKSRKEACRLVHPNIFTLNKHAATLKLVLGVQVMTDFIWCVHSWGHIPQQDHVSWLHHDYTAPCEEEVTGLCLNKRCSPLPQMSPSLVTLPDLLMHASHPQPIYIVHKEVSIVLL